MNPLFFLLIYAGVYLLHELGHILAYRHAIKKWPRVAVGWNLTEIGVPEDWRKASRKERRFIIELGVLAGLYAILFSFVVTEDRWALAMLPVYLYHSRRDLLTLARI